MTRTEPLFSVREVRPTDGAAVLSMYARCSRQTRYSRWLTPASTFPEPYLRSLLSCSSEQLAVVAACDRHPSHVLGLASAALTSDGWRELGLLVEDRYQAQGVGRLMLDALVALLDPSEGLCAYALPENRWLFDKLARFGTVTIRHEYGMSGVRVVRAQAA